MTTSSIPQTSQTKPIRLGWQIAAAVVVLAVRPIPLEAPHQYLDKWLASIVVMLVGAFILSMFVQMVRAMGNDKAPYAGAFAVALWPMVLWQVVVAWMR